MKESTKDKLISGISAAVFVLLSIVITFSSGYLRSTLEIGLLPLGFLWLTRSGNIDLTRKQVGAVRERVPRERLRRVGQLPPAVFYGILVALILLCLLMYGIHGTLGLSFRIFGLALAISCTVNTAMLLSPKSGHRMV
eukprot:tig00021352_g20702.t1